MATIHKNISLRRYNSFGIDARADLLVEWNSVEDLADFIAANRHLFTPESRWDILGAGCNTLFAADYKGTLLHSTAKGIEVVSSNDQQVVIRAAAGELWDDVVAWSVERGLWGMENLSAIPSSVGASAVQNIGAYGAEAKDCIVEVECLDVATLEKVVIPASECAFGYRESIFKEALKGKVIITAVLYRLGTSGTPRLDYGSLRPEVEKLGTPTPANIRKAVVAIRDSKLPNPEVVGNAGSFFKNPVLPRAQVEALKAQYPTMPVYEVAGNPEVLKIATGWMIDTLGWKGKGMGNAGVHDKQALVLVNRGGATGPEVVALAEEICRQVKEKFGVEITPEVNIL